MRRVIKGDGRKNTVKMPEAYKTVNCKTLYKFRDINEISSFNINVWMDEKTDKQREVDLTIIPLRDECQVTLMKFLILPAVLNHAIKRPMSGDTHEIPYTTCRSQYLLQTSNTSHVFLFTIFKTF